MGGQDPNRAARDLRVGEMSEIVTCYKHDLKMMKKRAMKSMVRRTELRRANRHIEFLTLALWRANDQISRLQDQVQAFAKKKGPA